jgi:uncharacterized coiled-coil protein SlyX
MKKILYALLMALVCSNLSAQNKTIKVLMEQIAALHVYIDYAQKGYTTVKKGLNAIGDFKRGEFNLHSDYFISLGIVNPAVKNYARVAEILSLQAGILQDYNDTRQALQEKGDLFYGDELAYAERAFGRLLADCEDTLAELEAVVTDGQLEMKDDERLQRIDGLYTRMMDNYTFCHSFSGTAKLLAASREKEENDLRNGRALHGINDD